MSFGAGYCDKMRQRVPSARDKHIDGKRERLGVVACILWAFPFPSTVTGIAALAPI